MTRQWRSLDQLAEDPSFLARAAQEFPGLAESLAQPSDRRRVLKLMAAAFAMGGLTGCDAGSPGGHLIPAVRQPPSIVPGLVRWSESMVRVAPTVLLKEPPAITFASPKSRILAWPRLVTKMFAGLMSR